jgi:hypothetical protein
LRLGSIPHSAFRIPPVAVLTALAVLFTLGSVRAQDVEGRPVFDWDLVSLEQNSHRSNGSVLSGFHNLRSAGVTPYRAWKTGLGLIYSQEDQVATGGGQEDVFSTQRIIMNPKLNYGFYESFEAGVGLEANYVRGKDVRQVAGEAPIEESEDNADLSSGVAGLKWNFLRLPRLRLGASFDSRIAAARHEFGMLELTLFNAEVDGEYYFTDRFSLVSNLQFMTSDNWRQVRDELVLDVSGQYTFSDEFRGLVFATAQEDDPASTAVIFVGFAGQYMVGRRHAIAIALDFQVNDASREIETRGQLDLELSYTFTF